ncbi:ATP-binding protein [Catenulispora yoronensis]
MRDLLAALDRLRMRAARGTGKPRVPLRDLASATGVPRSSLANYLSGATLMPADVLDAVVLALGASPAEAREWANAREAASAERFRGPGGSGGGGGSGGASTGGSGTGRGAGAGAGSTPAAPRPRQLPADVMAFTGRKAFLKRLDELSEVSGGTAVTVSVVAGTAGVGKTALAVHWAHRVADRFPDGQLYVDLRGYDPGEPLASGVALERFLRALGAGAIPDDPDERSALYRSTLVGRRLLVVLDNARTAEQVRPLLPGSAGTHVLVTSRDGLAGLVARDGAQRVALDRLSPEEGLELLRRLLGPEAVHGDPEACAELVRLCAGLPLALRIAAERAVRHTERPLRDLAAELADRTRTLDLLDASGDPLSDVRAVFSWSYDDLPAPAARLFRLLGLRPGPDVDAHGAANLAGTELGDTRRLLGVLAGVHLIEPVADERYQLHDLLRVYAAELTEREDSEADRRSALTRLADWSLHTAYAAMDRVNPNRRPLPAPPAEPAVPGPPLPDADAARGWLEAERPGLVAQIRHDADTDWPVQAWQLANTLWTFFYRGGHRDDWFDTHDNALSAARRLGDAYAEGEVLHAVGVACFAAGRHDQAVSRLQASLAVRDAIGDRRGRAATLNALGASYHATQRYDLALEHHRQALATNRENGDRYAAALNLANIALTFGDLGRYRDAIDQFDQNLLLLRDLGDRQAEALTMANIGRLRTLLGEQGPAFAALNEALATAEETGDQRNRAYSLLGLGIAHARFGQPGPAAEHGRRALGLAREFGDPNDEASALSTLGLASLQRGDPAKALDYQLQALAVCRDEDNNRWAGQIHNDAGEIYRRIGQRAAALEHHRAALELSAAGSNRYEEGRAEFGLALALAPSGDSGTGTTAPAAKSEEVAEREPAAKRETLAERETVADTGLDNAGQPDAGQTGTEHTGAGQTDAARAAVHAERALRIFTALGVPEAAAVMERFSGLNPDPRPDSAL